MICHRWGDLRVAGGWGAAGAIYLLCEKCGRSFTVDEDDVMPRIVNAKTEEERAERKRIDEHFGAKAARFYAAESRQKAKA